MKKVLIAVGIGGVVLAFGIITFFSLTEWGNQESADNRISPATSPSNIANNQQVPLNTNTAPNITTGAVPSGPNGSRTFLVDSNSYNFAEPEISPEALVADWKFSEGTSTIIGDASSFSNTGTAVRAHWPIFRTPGGDVAASGFLDFNGKDSRIEVPSSPSLAFSNGSEISISAWIRPVALHPFQTILVKDRTAGDNYANYAFRVGSGRYGGVQQLEFYYKSPSGIWQEYVTTRAAIEVNQWQHVAFTYTFGRAESAKLYVNAIKEEGKWMGGTGDDPPVVSVAPLWIGSINANNGVEEAFDGLIGDVRVYNRILNQAEIQAMYGSVKLPWGIYVLK